jgi:hypothetical protein
MSSTRRWVTRRRVLVLLGAGALLCGLAMLHPYPRQSLFGPKVRGVPWCVWEAEMRRQTDPEGHGQLWSSQLRRLLGIKDDGLNPQDEFDPELLPLLLHTLRHRDAVVRRRTYHCLLIFPEWFRDPAACEPLLEPLEELDLAMRLDAAEAHWKLFQDTRVFPILLKAVKDPDGSLHRRFQLIDRLGDMCIEDRTLVPKLGELMDDKDSSIRKEFLNAGTPLFGPDMLPYLLRGLRDDTFDVRAAALFQIASLRQEAKSAAPALEAMLKEERNRALWPDIRRSLELIDPVRHPENPKE